MNVNLDMEVLSMSLMSFDYLGEMARMRREIDRVLGDDRVSSWTFPFSRISFLPGRASRAYPLMNISEDNDNIYVDALAPGLEPAGLECFRFRRSIDDFGRKEAAAEEYQIRAYPSQ